ncbi:unnamed protein product [Prunus brigantina]
MLGFGFDYRLTVEQILHLLCDIRVDYIFLSPARGFDRYALRANHPILQGYAFSG